MDRINPVRAETREWNGRGPGSVRRGLRAPQSLGHDRGCRNDARWASGTGSRRSVAPSQSCDSLKGSSQRFAVFAPAMGLSRVT
jgi:hypothetical protein